MILLPGEYTPADEILLEDAIHVHGEVGAPPTISSSAFNALFLNDPGAVLSDVRIEGTSHALLIFEGLAERVFAKTSGSINACALGSLTSPEGAIVRDSVCWSTGVSGVGAGGALGGITSGYGLLLNVTAIASGVSGVGVESVAGGGATLMIDGVNVIAEGGSADLHAETTDTESEAVLTMEASNFANVQATVTGTSVTAPGSGTNQTEAPLFVDAENGDFHQMESSPTRDSGIPDAPLGSLDIDGEARTQGSAVDIGADEFPAPEPEEPTGEEPSSGSESTTTTPPPPDKPPVLWGLRLHPRFFSALGKRRGTTVRYQVSELSRLVFLVQRRLRGRVALIRGKRRCVRPTRALVRRGANPCPRFRNVGRFFRRGARGHNVTRFAGWLHHKPLARGWYRILAAAIDTAGQRSSLRRHWFRILPIRR